MTRDPFGRPLDTYAPTVITEAEARKQMREFAREEKMTEEELTAQIVAERGKAIEEAEGVDALAAEYSERLEQSDQAKPEAKKMGGQHIYIHDHRRARRGIYGGGPARKR